MANKNKKHNYPLYHVEPFADFREMLDRSAAREGNKPAFRFRDGDEIKEVSYAAFKTETEALGTGLASLDAARCHIAIVSENSYKWITVFLTTMKSEGVFIPVDRELPANEIANILNTADCEVLFFSKTYAEKIRSIMGALPRVRYFIGLDLDTADGNCLSYRELMKEGYRSYMDGDTSFTSMKPQDDAMKMLVFTSGTTGKAKGVMLSQHNLISNIYYGLMVSTVYDTSLSVLPYNHTYESVCGILVQLSFGTTICINESLRTVTKNLKLYKPKIVLLVPLFVESMYKKIWAEIDAKGKTEDFRKLMAFSNRLLKFGIDLRPMLFKSIRDVFGGELIKIVCGGAPVRQELGEFFEAIGITLINGYGITECSPLVCANRDYFYNFASVGTRLPCVELRIDEPNEDGEGEICVKGDTVMMGYYKMPELTDEVFDDEGWFHTGDYGRIAADERLYITGRKKNMIVLKNGKNIYPEEIEEYLSTIPYIAEVIVSAVRNEENEEIGLCAEIYPDEEATADMTDEQILSALKERIAEVNDKLPAYKGVHTVKLRKEAFNKTTSGKIRRNYADKQETQQPS